MIRRINLAKQNGHTVALLAMVVVVGCGKADPPVIKAELDDRELPVISAEPDDRELPVISAERDDRELQKATDDARQTVDQFIVALQNPKPSHSYLGLKAKFVEGDEVEFMWLSDVTYENDTYVGTVANNPVKLRNVKIMDRQEVSRNEIQDWMIVDDGRLVGGYSLRVLAKRMSAEERTEMEIHMGFTLD